MSIPGGSLAVITIIHQHRPLSQHQREDQQLAEHIYTVYHACRQVYGSPRIHAELRDQGITVSRKRVARLMREQGLLLLGGTSSDDATRSEPGARVAPNLLEQDFTASRPNEKWTGDITAIWTYEGWGYLAVVLDLYSRCVIGWAMAASQDEALIERGFPDGAACSASICGSAVSFGSGIAVYE